MESENENTRTAVAIVFRSINEEKVVDNLIKMLNDKYFNVVWNALESLGTIGNQKAIDPIMKKLEIGDKYVRKYAIKALEKFNTPEAIKIVGKNKADEASKPKKCFHQFRWEGDLLSNNRYKVCVKCGHIEYPG